MKIIYDSFNDYLVFRSLLRLTCFDVKKIVKLASIGYRMTAHCLVRKRIPEIVLIFGSEFPYKKNTVSTKKVSSFYLWNPVESPALHAVRASAAADHQIISQK